MSRTKRYISVWARIENAGKNKWLNGLLGIGDDFYRIGYGLPLGQIDPRSRYHHGYDGGIRSRIYDNCGWKEERTGPARKFFKRQYHKERRRNDKIEQRKYIVE